MIGKIIRQLIVILILTIFNALFAAAEMSIVNVKLPRIKKRVEKGEKRAKRLMILMQDPNRFLSTVQVAITISGFLSSASAAATISTYFGDILTNLGLPYAHIISVVLITIILSIFTLIFGELIPKRIALINSEEISLKLSGLVYFIYILFKPLVNFLSFVIKNILKIFGIKSEAKVEKFSEEDIKTYISLGARQGLLNLEDANMIIRVFDFDDAIATSIMTPRIDVYGIDITKLDINLLKEVLASGYSRIPVYEESIDKILGILYVKDILLKILSYSEYELQTELKNSYINIDIKSEIREILRKPYFVPDNKKINILLRELKAKKTHMAILLDEYGGCTGILTIEDILEEIVGEIEDEYDEARNYLTKINKNTFIVDGRLEISTFYEKTGIKLKTNNASTIAGLYIDILGYIPTKENKDEYIEIDNIKLTIIEISGTQLEKFKIEILK